MPELREQQHFLSIVATYNSIISFSPVLVPNNQGLFPLGSKMLNIDQYSLVKGWLLCCKG